ncbi:MAG: hypothetical protein IKU27_06885, partial [Clostridia bacterium]|nr:hypothetical protein [Clostridia bacterium]
NDLPLLFFVQLADRTFIIAKGVFLSSSSPEGFLEPRDYRVVFVYIKKAPSSDGALKTLCFTVCFPKN